MVVNINKLVSPKGLNNLKLKDDLDVDNLKTVAKKLVKKWVKKLLKHKLQESKNQSKYNLRSKIPDVSTSIQTNQ